MLCFQVLWWARKIPGGVGSLKERRVVALALTCERERWEQTRPNLLLGEVVLVLVVVEEEEEEEENKRVEWRGRRRHTRILSGFRGWVAVV